MTFAIRTTNRRPAYLEEHIEFGAEPARMLVDYGQVFFPEL